MSQPTEVTFQVEIEDEVTTARDLMIELNNQTGYLARPNKGTILDVAAQIVQNIHDNKDFLMTLFGAASPALKYLLGKYKTPDKQLKVSMEIDGKSITVEGEDAEQVTRLVEKFEKAYPEEAKKVTPKSKVKVKAHKN